MGASDLAHPNDQLRQERLRRNWRQREVADWVGTTVVTVNRWERGNQQPSAYFRVKLCALFDKSAEELGITSEDPQPSSEAETEPFTSVENFALSADASDQLQHAHPLPCEDPPDARVVATPSLEETLWPTYVLAQKERNRIRILRKLEWLESGQQRAYIWLSIMPTAILVGLMVGTVWIICRH